MKPSIRPDALKSICTGVDMELYVIGVGSRCVIANDRLQGWGKLECGKLFSCRSVAHTELSRIEAPPCQSTMKTYINRVGPEEFPRYIIVNEDDEVWNGQGFGHIRSGLIYAHRDLAEQDAARIEAERSDFFQSE